MANRIPRSEGAPLSVDNTLPAAGPGPLPNAADATLDRLDSLGNQNLNDAGVDTSEPPAAPLPALGNAVADQGPVAPPVRTAQVSMPGVMLDSQPSQSERLDDIYRLAQSDRQSNESLDWLMKQTGGYPPPPEPGQQPAGPEQAPQQAPTADAPPSTEIDTEAWIASNRAILSDLGKGLIDPKAWVGGPLKAGKSTLAFFDSISDWVRESSGIDPRQFPGLGFRNVGRLRPQEDVTPLAGMVPNPGGVMDAPETTTGQILQAVTQFGAEFYGLGKFVPGAKASAPGIDRLGRQFVRATAAEYLGFEGHEKNFADLLRLSDNPILNNAATEWLSNKEGENEFVNRLKNALAAGPLNAVLPWVMNMGAVARNQRFLTHLTGSENFAEAKELLKQAGMKDETITTIVNYGLGSALRESRIDPKEFADRMAAFHAMRPPTRGGRLRPTPSPPGGEAPRPGLPQPGDAAPPTSGQPIPGAGSPPSQELSTIIARLDEGAQSLDNRVGSQGDITTGDIAEQMGREPGQTPQAPQAGRAAAQGARPPPQPGEFLGSDNAPLVERIERQLPTRAEYGVPDQTLARWMFDNVNRGEWSMPAPVARNEYRPTPRPSDEPPANLDMIRLTNDEVDIVMNALMTRSQWYQAGVDSAEARRSLFAGSDRAALEEARNAASAADKELRRRFGEGTANALIKDVMTQVRAGDPVSRPSFDDIAKYVRERFGFEGEVGKPDISAAASSRGPTPHSGLARTGKHGSLPEEAAFRELMGQQYEIARASGDLSGQYDILGGRLINDRSMPAAMREAMELERARLAHEMGADGRRAAGIPDPKIDDTQAAARLPQSLARAISGADETLSAHWKELTPPQKLEIQRQASVLPPHAVAESISARAMDLALDKGKAVTIEPRVVEAVAGTVDRFSQLLPQGYKHGVLKRVEPHVGGKVVLTFHNPKGDDFEFALKREDFDSLRAFHAPGPDRFVGILRKSAPVDLGDDFGETFRLSLGGEFSHELVHTQFRNLPAVVRDRLVGHAQSLRLSDDQPAGVMNTVAEDYFKGIAREDVLHPSYIGRRNVTLGHLYEHLYRNRPNKEQLLQEEAVANMVELIHHGHIKVDSVPGLREDLEVLFSQNLPVRAPGKLDITAAAKGDGPTPHPAQQAQQSGDRTDLAANARVNETSSLSQIPTYEEAVQGAIGGANATPPALPKKLKVKKDPILDWYDAKIGPHSLTVSFDKSYGKAGEYDLYFMVDGSTENIGVGHRHLSKVLYTVRQIVTDFIATKRPAALTFEAAGGDPQKDAAWSAMGDSLARRFGGRFHADADQGGMRMEFPAQPELSKLSPKEQIADARAALASEIRSLGKDSWGELSSEEKIGLGKPDTTGTATDDAQLHTADLTKLAAEGFDTSRVYYHGTATQPNQRAYDKFDLSKDGETFGVRSGVVWFAKDRADAQWIADRKAQKTGGTPRVVEAYLRNAQPHPDPRDVYVTKADDAHIVTRGGGDSPVKSGTADIAPEIRAEFVKAPWTLGGPEVPLFSAVRVDGRVFISGFSIGDESAPHGVAIDRANAAGAFDHLDDLSAFDYGFITNTGRFVDRQEALELGVTAGSQRAKNVAASKFAGLGIDSNMLPLDRPAGRGGDSPVKSGTAGKPDISAAVSEPGLSPHRTPPPLPARFKFEKVDDIDFYRTKIGPHELEVSYTRLSQDAAEPYDVEFTIDNLNDDAGVAGQHLPAIFHAVRQSLVDFIAKRRPHAITFEAAGDDPQKSRAWAAMGHAMADRFGGRFEKVGKYGQMTVVFPPRQEPSRLSTEEQIAEARRGGAESVKSGTAEMSELPLDPAARKARAEAMGFTTPAFHATRTDFDRADPFQGDFGFHVSLGTPHAANARLRYPKDGKQSLPDRLRGALGKTDDFVQEDGDRILPLMVRLENPLKTTRDLIDWDSVDAWAVWVSEKNYKGPQELKTFVTDWANREGFGNEGHKFSRALATELERLGYDGVVYKNAVESPGAQSALIWNPAQIRSVNAEFDPSQEGSSQLMAAAGGNMPPVPPGGSPPATPPSSNFSREFNVNWTHIEGQDQLKQVAGQMMDAFRDDLVQRGVSGGGRGHVQTWEQTAKQAGMLDAIEHLFKVGEQKGLTHNAVGMEALGTLYVSSMNELKRLVGLAASPQATPETYVQMRHQMTMHRMVQNEFWGGVSEAGRTLNILRKVKSSSQGYQQSLQQIIESTGGVDSNRALAEALAGYIDGGEYRRLDQVLEKGITARTIDAVIEMRTGGLLTGPPTWERNILSNTLAVPFSILERKVAEYIGAVLHPVDGVKFGEAAAMAQGQMRSLREGLSALAESWTTGEFRIGQSSVEQYATRPSALGADAMKLSTPDAWRNRQEPAWAERGDPNAPKGNIGPHDARRFKALGDPKLYAQLAAKPTDTFGLAVDILSQVYGHMSFRPTGAPDAFFKVVHKNAELYAQAWRKANDEILRGEISDADFETRLTELRQNPTEDMTEAANRSANTNTWTDENTSTLGRTVQMLRSAEHPAVRLAANVLVPFWRTPSRILNYAFERTPLAPLSAKVAKAIGDGGAEADLAYARMALGTMMLGLGGSLLVEGWITDDKDAGITGGMPTKRPLREAVWRLGAKDYSVRVPTGETDGDGDPVYAFIPIQNIGGATDIFLWGAMLADARNRMDHLRNRDPANVDQFEIDWDKAMAAAVFASADLMMSKSSLQGVSEFMRAIGTRETTRQVNWSERLLQSFVPASSGLRYARRHGVPGVVEGDPVKREVTSYIDALYDLIPGLSTQLPPSLDTWGRPVTYQSGLGGAFDAFVPSAIRTTENAQAIDKELLRLGWGPETPRSISILRAEAAQQALERGGSRRGGPRRDRGLGILDSVLADPSEFRTGESNVVTLSGMPKVMNRLIELRGQTTAAQLIRDNEDHLISANRAAVIRSLDEYGDKTLLQTLNGLVKDPRYLSRDMTDDQRQQAIKDIIRDYETAAKAQVAREFPELQKRRDAMPRPQRQPPRLREQRNPALPVGAQ